MTGDLNGDEVEDERNVELASIAAIYPELIIESPFTAFLDVPVVPVPPLAVFSPHLPERDVLPTNGLKQLNINHAGPNLSAPESRPVTDAGHVQLVSNLPPVRLRISLPDGYPSTKPPAFDIQTVPSWLPKDVWQELQDEGCNIWEEMGRDQVVFTYIDHLRDTVNAFGLREPLEVTPDLKLVLLDFDLKAKRAQFEQETFDCGICLEPKKGSACHRLQLCAHVFCVKCLQDFYNTCITEGDVSNVKCIAPNCGAEPSTPSTPNSTQNTDRTLDPSELLQIPLSQKTTQRYITLKRKKHFESIRSTIYCPRQWCQGPARIPSAQTSSTITSSPTTTSSSPAPLQTYDNTTTSSSPAPLQTYDNTTPASILPPPAERLAICTDCTFAFCSICKASWHGEYYACFPRSRYELSAEEKASEDYMKLHTQPCPTCDARAQKTHGCNHMICWKCETHFCYLCGAFLEKGNPYRHYNDKGNGCFMRLWELEAGDGGEVGQGFGGGGGDPGARWEGLDGGGGDDVVGVGGAAERDGGGPWEGIGDVERENGHDNDHNDVHDWNDAVQDVVVGEGELHHQIMAIPPAAPNPPRPRPRPPQQRQQNGDPPAPAPREQQHRRGEAAQGLQRFLQMVIDDEEDEWDSDELGEEGELEWWE